MSRNKTTRRQLNQHDQDTSKTMELYKRKQLGKFLGTMCQLVIDWYWAKHPGDCGHEDFELPTICSPMKAIMGTIVWVHFNEAVMRNFFLRKDLDSKCQSLKEVFKEMGYFLLYILVACANSYSQEYVSNALKFERFRELSSTKVLLAHTTVVAAAPVLLILLGQLKETQTLYNTFFWR